MIAFGALWGLAALAALPAIFAIHWFRRRAPPRRVSGLFLWPQPAPSAASGRRRERIVNLPSLWLELLAALALAWWLADAHLRADDHGRHLVVVLDDRVRLQALAPSGDTAADRLRTALGGRIAGLGNADRVTLVASGAVPRLLAGPAADVESARRALAAWRPESAWHDLEPALALAAQLAGAGGGGELLLASDRVPERLAEEIGCLARGVAVPGTGLADARWLRDARGERLVLRIVGDGAPRPLEVRAGDVLLARASAAAGTLVVPLPTAPEELTVALIGEDPLPADDRAILRRPPSREVRVSVDLPAARRPLVDKVLAVVPGVVSGGAAPDLVISAADGSLPGAWSLAIAPATGAEAALGPFLTRSGHPLCLDLDGTGLLWVGGLPRAQLAADASPLVSAGEQVLLAEHRRGRDRGFALHADLAAGTLAQHPFWPALLANLVEARRAALPGCATPTVAVGRPVPVVLPAGHGTAELTAPDGAVTNLVADGEGVVLVPALDRAGAWRISLDGSPWLVLQALALDARMADLAGAATADRAGALVGPVAVERRRSPAERVLPLLIAAGAAIGAWLLSRRGR